MLWKTCLILTRSNNLLEMGHVVEVPMNDAEAPEADLLEQVYVVEPEEVDLEPSLDPEAPVRDAREQARLVNRDERDAH